MLVKLEDRKIKFCTLVEHPAGGEFPQYETYGLADNGSAYYSTGMPECPTDCFADEEESDYVHSKTHNGAVENLKGELEEVVVSAPEFVEAFANATEFVVYFEDEVWKGGN